MAWPRAVTREIQSSKVSSLYVGAPSVPSETNIMRAWGMNGAFMQARSLSAGPPIAASIAAGMLLGSDGNAQPTPGACAMALPASAPPRIVAKNSARSICKLDVGIEHRPFLSGTDQGGIALLASYISDAYGKGALRLFSCRSKYTSAA